MSPELTAQRTALSARFSTSGDTPAAAVTALPSAAFAAPEFASAAAPVVTNGRAVRDRNVPASTLMSCALNLLSLVFYESWTLSVGGVSPIRKVSRTPPCNIRPTSGAPADACGVRPAALSGQPGRF